MTQRTWLSGKRFAVGFALFLFAVSAFSLWRWYSTRWPGGAVIGWVGVDAERVLVFRKSDNYMFKAHMVCLDREQGPVWSKGIYGMQHPHAQGVFVQADEVRVAALDSKGKRQVHEFKLNSGKFEGVHDAKVVLDRPSFERPTLYEDPVIRLRRTERGLVLEEVRNGRTLWERPEEERKLRHTVRVKDGLLLQWDDGQLWHLSAVDGRSRVRASVLRADPEAHPLLPQHVVDGVVWVGNGAGVRPLSLEGFRPLGHALTVPRVRAL